MTASPARPPFRGRAPAASAALAALALLAAGCSTPVDHYHTLRPIDAPAAADTLHRSGREPVHVLAVGPVTVPDALARDEWVIRTGDTGVQVYDHQLWTQELAADIAQSLVDRLDGGALQGVPPEPLWADAGPTGSGSGADLGAAPPLRVRVQVLRFDSVLSPAPAIADQVRWTLECLPSDKTLSPLDAGRFRLVRSGVRDVAGAAPPAGSGGEESQRRFDRLASAHGAAMRQVADDIAAALRESADERARDCQAPGR